MTVDKLRALIALTASPVHGEASNAALLACKALRENSALLGALAPVNGNAVAYQVTVLNAKLAEKDRELATLRNELAKAKAQASSPPQGATKAPTFARFPARFRGKCKACQGAIGVGDAIAYSKQDETYHDGCCPS